MSFEETIALLAGGMLVLVSSFVSMKLYFKRKSKLLAFFSFSWLFIALYLTLTAVADVTRSTIIYKVNDSVIVTLALVFFMAFLDYAQHDSISPMKISISLVFVAIIFTWNWYPANVLMYVDGTGFVMPFATIYVQIQNVYLAALSISVAYWQMLTARKAPPSFKKLTRLLHIGSVFGIIAAISVFVSTFPTSDPAFMEIEGYFYMLLFASITAMAFVSTVAISKEPRLVHILPFTVYRLLVTSKGGNLYYAKEWNKVDVDSVLISGMMSAVNTFSKGALKEDDKSNTSDVSKRSNKFDAGVVSEIKLQKAVMLCEMKYAPLNIMLLSSKTSKDLKDSLEAFSKAISELLYERLYTKDGFPIEVSPAEISTVFSGDKINPVAEKYFSNIPSFN